MHTLALLPRKLQRGERTRKILICKSAGEAQPLKLRHLGRQGVISAYNLRTFRGYLLLEGGDANFKALDGGARWRAGKRFA
jgi:hypothetical protein